MTWQLEPRSLRPWLDSHPKLLCPELALVGMDCGLGFSSQVRFGSKLCGDGDGEGMSFRHGGVMVLKLLF